MIYLAYMLLAVIVVWVSIKLSVYVDLLDKTTNLSGAFIGGVMLAAVTSLPELFTSISATVFVGQPDMVMGNILGSNLFNLIVLGALVLFGIDKFRKCFISKSHKYVIIWTIVIYAIIACVTIFGFDLKLWHVSFASIAILIIYLVLVKNMASDEKEEFSEPITSRLSTKQILFRFSIMSVILVIASVAITYVTDIIAVELNLGMTFAGALLLGVATSIPELTSSVSLAKMGNYNAMTGNIVGSNLFNMTIIFVADVLYTGGSIYTSNYQSFNLVVLGALSAVFITIILLTKSLGDKVSKGLSTVIYGFSALMTIVSYIAFIVLSM